MHLALYNLIVSLLLPLALLRLLFKALKVNSYRKRLGERLGFIKAITQPVIWVHCVSVGEFRAVIVLINALIKIYPNHKILITSTTHTSSKAIIDHYQNQVLHTYFPFDIGFIVKCYIKKIQPDLCLLLETEIWPNLIHTLHKNKVPILLINARLSQRSFNKYRRFKNLTAQTLKKISLIAAQNQNSAQRFIELGTNKERVMVSGNIKFDQTLSADIALTNSLKNLIGKRKVVVFASTHKGEEKAILNAYLKKPIDALMIIIPRHPERFNKVFKLAKKNQLSVAKRSDNKLCKDCQILIGDSMGEMMTYFTVADVVFIGGSLIKSGGHNMLEPAALSKPILFGPHVFNFSEISSALLKQQGAIKVQNANQLLEETTQLLANDKVRKNLGNNANQYFKSQQGALKTLVKQIEKLL